MHASVHGRPDARYDNLAGKTLGSLKTAGLHEQHSKEMRPSVHPENFVALVQLPLSEAGIP